MPPRIPILLFRSNISILFGSGGIWPESALKSRSSSSKFDKKDISAGIPPEIAPFSRPRNVRSESKEISLGMTPPRLLSSMRIPIIVPYRHLTPNHWHVSSSLRKRFPWLREHADNVLLEQYFQWGPSNEKYKTAMT